MRFRGFGRSFLLALGVLVTGAWTEPAPPAPPNLNNMDFEEGAVGQPPPGWWGQSISTSADRPQGGAKSLLLRNDASTPANFGRAISAAPFQGKSIRFRAVVRTDSPAGAGLWLRIDGPKGKMLFLDNMSDRLVRASEWKWAEIKVEVPPEAERLILGGLIYGAGTAGFDTASLEILPESAEPITPEAQAYLDRALDILQARHINKDQVDWPRLRAHAEAAAAHAQTPADTYNAIRLAIGELGEKHTLLLPPTTDMQLLAAGPSPAPLEVRSLGEHVVELKLPGTGDPVGAKYIETLRTAIAQHERAGACGWIVDLRDDTGGNMWPMLNGLAALLGPPPWGYFRNAGGGLTVWTYHGGDATTAPAESFHNPTKLPYPGPLQPVAVLLGPRTTSAGEMTALAFVGRTNARSFGAPTAGFTTANSLVALPDGAALALTDGRVLDRSGALIDGPLKPDELTAPDNAEAAALAWLLSMHCH